MALDPVCGMTVDPAKAAGQFEHKGTSYYFCSKGCLAKFAADPEKYLAGAREPMAVGHSPVGQPAVLSIGGLKKAKPANPQSAIPNPQSKDPVCGMTVDPAKAAGQFEHKGTSYYFCSKGCLAKFAADPEKYLAGAREPMAVGHSPVGQPAVLSIGGLKKAKPANPQSAIPNPQSKDPVCGMTVDPAKAAGQFEHKGTSYYFCSKGCLAKFAADPEKYLAGAREPMAVGHSPVGQPAVLSIGGLKKAKPANPQSAIPNPQSKDPVCGMTVDPAKAAGQFEHKGTSYYFCSKGCLAKFAADPEKYLAGAREPMAVGHSPVGQPAVLSIGGLKKAKPANPQSAIPNPQSKDPVCGMTVDPAKAAGQFEHKGTSYYFCSKGCLAKFAADPEKYLAGAREPMAVGHSPVGQPAVLSIGGLKKSTIGTPQPIESPLNPQSAIRNPRSTEWICPMDPEVISDRPGACPKCGMALEPKVA